MELKKDIILNGKYKIEKILSLEGGFSIVYLAVDMASENKVVVKELFPRELADRDGLEVVVEDIYRFKSLKHIFETESRILSVLNHEAIVNFIDYFEENNTVYIVMSYARGRNLKEYIIEEKKLSFIESLKIFNKILDAAEYMHSKDIIHRDIKPGNIIIRKEDKNFEVKIIDFGSACKLSEKDDDFIRVSRGYSPIEMYATESQHHYGTDIYSIFATFCHMLEGKKIRSAPKRIFNSEISLERDMSSSLRNLICKNLNINLDDRDTNIKRVKEKLFVDGLDTREEEIKMYRWMEEY